jgi:hypothetical protein
MKRGIVALIIFCFIIFFSCYCSYKNKIALESAKTSIEEIFNLCETGEIQNAYNKSDELKTEWKKSRFILKITFEHDAVKEIETAVIELPMLIRSNNDEKARDVCEDALSEIEYLIDGEKLVFENIF